MITRLVLVMVMAVLALGLGGGSADAAAPGRVSETDARGIWKSDCVNPGEWNEICLFFSDLRVSELIVRYADGTTRQETKVCLFVETRRSHDAETSRNEQGCAFAPNGSISSTSMSSVTLAPVTVQLDMYSCPNDVSQECEYLGEREASISAAWAAKGELFKFRDIVSWEDEFCTYRLQVQGKQRPAVGTATLDGRSFGSAQQAYIAVKESSGQAHCQ